MLKRVFLLSSRLYCRLWNHTKSCLKKLAGCTAGWDLHPTPKELIQLKKPPIRIMARSKSVAQINISSIANILYILLSSRLYCRLWNHTKSCLKKLAGYTAGWDLHPTPKNSYSYVTIIIHEKENKARGK